MAGAKKKPSGGWNNPLIRKIGQLMGAAKQNAPDLVETWKEQCAAQGVRPLDRLKEFFGWDLENAGVSLIDLEAKKSERDQVKLSQDINLMQSFEKILQQMTTQNIQTQLENKGMMDSLIQEMNQIKFKQVSGVVHPAETQTNSQPPSVRQVDVVQPESKTGWPAPLPTYPGNYPPEKKKDMMPAEIGQTGYMKVGTTNEEGSKPDEGVNLSLSADLS
ncbi:hypothetical protein LCGC14_3049680, partial [marine sediment metagenome]